MLLLLLLTWIIVGVWRELNNTVDKEGGILLLLLLLGEWCGKLSNHSSCAWLKTLVYKEVLLFLWVWCGKLLKSSRLCLYSLPYNRYDVLPHVGGISSLQLTKSNIIIHPLHLRARVALEQYYPVCWCPTHAKRFRIFTTSMRAKKINRLLLLF